MSINNTGSYTKSAVILSLILVILAFVFVKRYLNFFKPVSSLEELNDFPSHDQLKKKTRPSPQNDRNALNEILSHQRSAIKALTKKNELIVANWNKKFEEIIKKNQKKLDDKRELLDSLIEAYAHKADALNDLVSELLPAGGVENKIQAGDLLLTIQQYDLAFKYYGEALDLIEEAGFKEEKTKTITVTVHKKIANTLLLIYKSSPDREVTEKEDDQAILKLANDHLKAAIKIDKDRYDLYYLQALVFNEEDRDISEVMESLAQAVEGKAVNVTQLLKDFDNFKDDPSFKEMVTSLAK